LFEPTVNFLKTPGFDQGVWRYPCCDDELVWVKADMRPSVHCGNCFRIYASRGGDGKGFKRSYAVVAEFRNGEWFGDKAEAELLLKNGTGEKKFETLPIWSLGDCHARICDLNKVIASGIRGPVPEISKMMFDSVLLVDENPDTIAELLKSFIDVTYIPLVNRVIDLDIQVLKIYSIIKQISEQMESKDESSKPTGIGPRTRR